jgi:glycosyltransferase involved in cell wall biosynthesis
MAAGCPLIVPDVGGFPEMVEHERNGLRFRVGDTQELATALRRLIDQPQLAASLGEKARADCRERYDPDRVAMRMLELYRGVLGLPERQAVS